MNIRIGDKVKILDRKMLEWYGLDGKVIDACWQGMYDGLEMTDLIGFEVKVEGRKKTAWFEDKNLIAYK